MSQIWRQVFAPEPYVDVVRSVMLHPDLGDSSTSLWSLSSTALSGRASVLSMGSVRSSLESTARAESVQPVESKRSTEELFAFEKPAIERGTTRREPMYKPEQSPRKSLSMTPTTPRSVSFVETPSVIGRSETWKSHPPTHLLSDSMEKQDIGKVATPRIANDVKPVIVSKVQPAAPDARTMSWTEFIDNVAPPPTPAPASPLQEANRSQKDASGPLQHAIEVSALRQEAWDKPKEGLELSSVSPAEEAPRTIEAIRERYSTETTKVPEEKPFVGEEELGEKRHSLDLSVPPSKTVRQEKQPQLGREWQEESIAVVDHPGIEHEKSELVATRELRLRAPSIVRGVVDGPLVGMHQPKHLKLRPLRFVKHKKEMEAATMEVPEVIKTALSELESTFEQVAAIEPEKEEELVLKAQVTESKPIRASLSVRRRATKEEAGKEAKQKEAKQIKPSLYEWQAVGGKEGVKLPAPSEAIILTELQEPTSELDLWNGGSEEEVRKKTPFEAVFMMRKGEKLPFGDKEGADYRDLVMESKAFFSPEPATNLSSHDEKPLEVEDTTEEKDARLEQALRRAIVSQPETPLVISKGQGEIVLKGITPPNKAKASPPTIGKLKKHKHAEKQPAAQQPEQTGLSVQQLQQDLRDVEQRLETHAAESVRLRVSQNEALKSQLADLTDLIGQLEKRIEKRQKKHTTGPTRKDKEAISQAGLEEAQALDMKSSKSEEVLKQGVSKTLAAKSPPIPIPKTYKSPRKVHAPKPIPSVNLSFFEPELFEERPLAHPEPAAPQKGSISKKAEIEQAVPQTRLVSAESVAASELAAKVGPNLVEPQFEHPAVISPEPQISIEGSSPPFKGPRKRLEQRGKAVHSSVDLTYLEPSLFATPKPAANQPFVNLPSFEKSLHSPKSGISLLVQAQKEFSSNWPSVNLQYFEPSLFTTPDPQPRPPIALDIDEGPNVQRKLVKQVKRKIWPSVSLKYFEPQLFERQKHPHVSGLTGQRIPSVDLQHFEPSIFEVSPAKRTAAIRSTGQRTPSVDLQHFEPPIFELPKKTVQKIPSVDLAAFEPALSATPSPAQKAMPSADLAAFEPSIAAPKSAAATKIWPSVDLTYFNPELFSEVKHLHRIQTSAPMGWPKDMAHRKDTSCRHPSVDLAFFEPTMFKSPSVKMTKKSPMPAVNLTYFEPSLFDLSEPSSEKEPKKKKRSWIHKVIHKLFHRNHVSPEEKEAKKRAKLERKLARKTEKKNKKAEKAAKKSKAKQVAQELPAPAPVRPAVDLTFFEPELFATPATFVEKKAPPQIQPSVNLEFFEPKLFDETQERNVVHKGEKAIKAERFGDKRGEHFYRNFVKRHSKKATLQERNGQWPKEQLSRVEKQVIAARKRMPSVNLEFFEPSLFATAPSFKVPAVNDQQKGKSPMLPAVFKVGPGAFEDLDGLPEHELSSGSLWEFALKNGGSDENVRCAIRERLHEGAAIPANLRASVWMTLSGGAQGHAAGYRNLCGSSNIAPRAGDNMHSIVARLTLAINAYHEALCGLSFECSIEPFIAQLAAWTIEVPQFAPLDSAVLYQEEQTFALALNLLYGDCYQLASVFTKHGLREWCYELDRIFEHEEAEPVSPSIAFAGNLFRDVFFSQVDDATAGRIMDFFVLEGRCALFRFAVAWYCNRDALFDIAFDLAHITNEQLGTLHGFEACWEQHRLKDHDSRKLTAEHHEEQQLLVQLKDLTFELEGVFYERDNMRIKLDHERRRESLLEHANHDMIFRMHKSGGPPASNTAERKLEDAEQRVRTLQDTIYQLRFLQL